MYSICKCLYVCTIYNCAKEELTLVDCRVFGMDHCDFAYQSFRLIDSIVVRVWHSSLSW